MLQIKYVGFDVHKATTVVMVLCADGSVFIRAEIPTTEQGIIGFLQTLNGTHVAFEENPGASATEIQRVRKSSSPVSLENELHSRHLERSHVS